MADNILPITDALLARRNKLGLSQSAVAERAGVTQTYLSKIERAKVDPRISTLQDVARAEGLELVLIPSDVLPAIRSMLADGPQKPGHRLFEAAPD